MENRNLGDYDFNSQQKRFITKLINSDGNGDVLCNIETFPMFRNHYVMKLMNDDATNLTSLQTMLIAEIRNKFNKTIPKTKEELESNLKEMTKAKDEIEKENINNKKNIHILEVLLDSSNKELEVILDRTYKEISQHITTINQLKNTILVNNNASNAELKKVNDEHQNLKTQYVKLGQEIVRISNEKNSLERELTMVSKELEDVKSNFKLTNDERQRLGNVNNNLYAEIAKYKQVIANYENGVNADKKEAFLLNQEISRIKYNYIVANKKHLNEVTGLYVELNQLKLDNKKLRNSLDGKVVSGIYFTTGGLTKPMKSTDKSSDKSLYNAYLTDMNTLINNNNDIDFIIKLLSVAKIDLTNEFFEMLLRTTIFAYYNKGQKDLNNKSNMPLPEKSDSPLYDQHLNLIKLMINEKDYSCNSLSNILVKAFWGLSVNDYTKLITFTLGLYGDREYNKGKARMKKEMINSINKI